MRIFYASDSTPNVAIASNLWRNNLLLPLRDLGHDVVEFDYDLRETYRHLDTSDARDAAFIAANRPVVSNALLSQVKTAHAQSPIELLFTYFYDACVEAKTIDAIRALGIVTVNWYCNGSYQLHLVSEISPHYDWCLVPEKFRLPDYELLGARPIYCQEAANPAIYKTYDVPQEFDVTFVGQAYGERPHYIRSLVDQGIAVRVWGPGWDRCAKRSVVRTLARALRSRLDRAYASPVSLPSAMLGPPLSDEDLVRMYSRSKINLGFSSVGNTHLSCERILQVRLRDFEVPMSGGFYMVEHMDELEEFFKIGEEIICYKGVEDLGEKINYYLAHDREREEIRRAGHERAMRDHTWQTRFRSAFEQMGFSGRL